MTEPRKPSQIEILHIYHLAVTLMMIMKMLILKSCAVQLNKNSSLVVIAILSVYTNPR